MVESMAAASGSRIGSSDDGAKLLRMQSAVRTLISGIGEDLHREGLLDTPKRVAKAFMEMSVGYRLDVVSVLNEAIFHEEEVGTSCSGVVVVRDIDFAALSEETLMPFYGRCHIAYLPSSGAVLGLSKLARITKLFAKRLQTQQQLGEQVLRCLQQQLAPLGVAVLLQAQHLGFGGADVSLLTAAVSGVFADEGSTQLQELLLLLGLEEQALVLTRVAQLCACRAACAIKGAPPPPAIRLTADSSISAAAGSGSSVMGDSVLAPSTPDPSEGDEEAAEAELEEEAHALAASCSSGAASPPARRQGSGAPAGLLGGGGGGCCRPGTADMEAAVQVLLREVGEEPQRPALQAAVKRYVSHLLASTAGYRQQLLQLAPRPEAAALAAASQSSAAAAAAAQAQAQAQAQAVTTAAHNSCSDSTPAYAGYQALKFAASATSEAAAAATLEEAATAADQVPVFSQASEESEPVGSRSSRHSQRYAVGSHASSSSVHYFSCRFASQCEHHMLPFQGSVHIAYAVPQGAQPAPAGQLQQLVAMYSQRLQLQERITHQLLQGAAQLTGAVGVMVVCEASHMCMVARGVENHGGATLSSACLGAFADDACMRASTLRRVRQQLTAQRGLQLEGC